MRNRLIETSAVARVIDGAIVMNESATATAATATANATVAADEKVELRTFKCWSALAVVCARCIRVRVLNQQVIFYIAARCSFRRARARISTAPLSGSLGSTGDAFATQSSDCGPKTTDAQVKICSHAPH